MGNGFAPHALPLTARSKAAALFLSTRPPAPDRSGIQPHREARQLADDVRAVRLLARPASCRSVEDRADQAQALDGFTDLREFTRARHAGRVVRERQCRAIGRPVALLADHLVS